MSVSADFVDTRAQSERTWRRHPRRPGLSGALLTAYGVIALAGLLIPIAVAIAFSFNDPAGRFNFTWERFTLDNWRHPFGVPGLADAMIVSLEIAAIASIAGCVLGTLMALALTRHRYRGRGLTNVLILLPITTPEVVMGASLLTLFLNLGVQTGFATIVLAHTMFVVSFVVIAVRARLIGMDPHLEEAARDLGANAVDTFRLVTLPMLWPGVLAGGLLAFLLSVDDFVITNFTSGTTVTFPLYVWGAARVGVPPQVNVIGTMIFVASIVIAAVTLLRQRRA